MRPLGTLSLLLFLVFVANGQAGTCVDPSGYYCVNCNDAEGRCSGDAECVGATGCACDDTYDAPADSRDNLGGVPRQHLCSDDKDEDTEPTSPLQDDGIELNESEVNLNRTSLTMIGAFFLSISGICCCIKHKRRTTGAEPSPAAWVSCLLIFFVAGPLGPCFMWAPFAIDACYRTRDGPQVGQRDQSSRDELQPVVALMVTQPITAVAVPSSHHGEPVTAVAVGDSWDGARGQPIVTGQVVRV